MGNLVTRRFNRRYVGKLLGKLPYWVFYSKVTVPIGYKPIHSDMLEELERSDFLAEYFWKKSLDDNPHICSTPKKVQYFAAKKQNESITEISETFEEKERRRFRNSMNAVLKEIVTAKLKRVPKSPGGTPMIKRPKRLSDSDGLKRLLKRRFEALHTPIAERSIVDSNCSTRIYEYE